MTTTRCRAPAVRRAVVCVCGTPELLELSLTLALIAVTLSALGRARSASRRVSATRAVRDTSQQHPSSASRLTQVTLQTLCSRSLQPAPWGAGSNPLVTPDPVWRSPLVGSAGRHPRWWRTRAMIRSWVALSRLASQFSERTRAARCSDVWLAVAGDRAVWKQGGFRGLTAGIRRETFSQTVRSVIAPHGMIPCHTVFTV